MVPVGAGVDLHDDAHGVVHRHGVDGLLDGGEVAGAAGVHDHLPHAHRVLVPVPGVPRVLAPGRRLAHGRRQDARERGQ